MKILITGGLGFIGGAVSRFLEKKHKVYIIDKKIVKRKNYYHCDLSNKKKLNKIKIKNIHTVLHFAAQSSVAKSFEDPYNDLNSNILGTFNLLNWCKRNNVKRIIFASTYNVYSEKTKKIFYSETDECVPNSYYGVSKLTNEMYLKLFCNNNKIKWNILRIFNAYGSNQEYTDYHGLINIYLYMAKKRGSILVKGKLNRVRDFIHIDDVIDALNLLIKSKKNNNEIFNIGTGKSTNLKDLIKIISKILNKKIIIKQKRSTKGDFNFCAANIKKISKKLKFKPKWNLIKGLSNVNESLNKKNENFSF